MPSKSDASKHDDGLSDLKTKAALSHYMRLGHEHVSNKRYADANQAFHAALELNPGNPWALLGLAEIQYACNRLDQAQAICAHILERFPKHLPALLALARCHLETGVWNKSLATYREILTINTQVPQAWWGVGQICLAMGDCEEAMRMFGQASTVSPLTMETMCTLAKTNLNHFEGTNVFLDFWHDLVNRYAKEIRAGGSASKELLDSLRKNLAENPNNPLMVYLLARLIPLDHESDRVEALDLLSKCAALLPRWPRIFVSLSEAEYLAHTSRSGTNDSGLHAVRSEVYIRQAVSLEPNNPDLYESLWVVLFFLGRTREAHEELARYSNKREESEERQTAHQSQVRFVLSATNDSLLGQGGIPSGSVGIGIISLLDYYIKSQELGIIPKKKTIVLAPVEKVVNPCYLEYWGDHVTLIQDPGMIERMLPLEPSFRYRIEGVGRLIDGQWGPWWEALAQVERKWEELGRGPLLQLKDEHLERGWRQLEALGMSRNDWFVCLHVRDDGCANAPNNADIETYGLAIEEITSRGGFVFRMGDPVMAPLSITSHRVFDYAHSAWRSDVMDVFLVSQCRFFIGTASGLGLVAHSFGIPQAMTNYTPQAARPFSSRDIFIPKLTRRINGGQLVSFQEAMEEPLGLNFLDYIYRRHGVELVGNSPMEIRALVTEMFDRLDGSVKYGQNYYRLQQEYNQITSRIRAGFGENSTIGKSFIEKYEFLLTK